MHGTPPTSMKETLLRLQVLHEESLIDVIRIVSAINERVLRGDVANADIIFEYARRWKVICRDIETSSSCNDAAVLVSCIFQVTSAHCN